MVSESGWDEMMGATPQAGMWGSRVVWRARGPAARGWGCPVVQADSTASRGSVSMGPRDGQALPGGQHGGLQDKVVISSRLWCLAVTRGLRQVRATAAGIVVCQRACVDSDHCEDEIHRTHESVATETWSVQRGWGHGTGGPASVTSRYRSKVQDISVHHVEISRGQGEAHYTSQCPERPEHHVFRHECVNYTVTHDHNITGTISSCTNAISQGSRPVFLVHYCIENTCHTRQFNGKFSSSQAYLWRTQTIIHLARGPWRSGCHGYNVDSCQLNEPSSRTFRASPSEHHCDEDRRTPEEAWDPLGGSLGLGPP